MKVLIIGGGGMVGQKLAHRLAAEGLGGNTPDVTLYDIGYPEGGAPASQRLTGNFAEPGEAQRLADLRADVIFHLAAIVSGEAEINFDLGWQVNLHATMGLLESLRAAHAADGYKPRLIFASSIAVFGAPFPEKIDDEFLCAPRTSYGAQKAMSELLIGDHARKGYIDAIALRLPTICVRPGKPNKAASSFFSNIIREPLVGQEAVLPVPDTVRHWHASPRSAAGFMIHAATLDFAKLDGRIALNLPGVSCTVAEQIEALEAVAGSGATKLIRQEPDPAIFTIVKGWPRDFSPDRARALGFRAEDNFREIVQTHIDDELPNN
ncbi:MAG: D-erythronate dehydrogenase [Pseudomonadota bacterium]